MAVYLFIYLFVLSITMVSSCKKENVEPVQTAVTTGNQSDVIIPKADWGMTILL